MKNCRITIAQLAPALLDLNKNTQRIAEILDAHSKTDLIVLPELYLTGYSIADKIQNAHDKAALKTDIDGSLRYLKVLSQRTHVDILISYPLFIDEPDFKPYIALEYISNGETLALHKKINLCNYAQYMEHLTFSAGDEVTVAKTLNSTAGLFICEDLWHITNAIFAASLGAEVLFYPSAATVLDKSMGESCLINWKRLTVCTAFSQTSYVICCNQAAGGDQYYFGGSHVVGPNGSVLCQLPLFDEAVANIELDGDALARERAKRPLVANERLEIYRKYI